MTPGPFFNRRRHYIFWLALSIFLGIHLGCVTEGPKKPQPQENSLSIMGPTVVADDAETIAGGKACVLSPADPINIPVGHYVCPNGIEFDQPCPSTGCSRVAPQPKRK